MKINPKPRDLVRIALAEYHPFDDSIEIVKVKRAGKDAAVAVAFESIDGTPRRGIIGLCKHHEGTWQTSGSFMGSAGVTGDRDVWMTWGGWGSGDSRERDVVGGWIADPAAVSGRLVDLTGRVLLEDSVENGVAVFMWKGQLTLDLVRLELLDAEQRVLRAGPVRQKRDAPRPRPTS